MVASVTKAQYAVYVGALLAEINMSICLLHYVLCSYIGDFEEFDRDQNGALCENELRGILRKQLGREMKADEFISYMKKTDLNEVGRISFHEYLNSVQYPPTHPPPNSRCFSFFS